MKTIVEQNKIHRELVDVKLLITKDDQTTESLSFLFPKCFIDEDKDGLKCLLIPINKYLGKTIL